MLRDSRARVESILALDADRLDLTGHRVRGSGQRRGAAGLAGGAGVIRWHARSSELLAPLTLGRPYGPVFLTDRRAHAGSPARTYAR